MADSVSTGLSGPGGAVLYTFVLRDNATASVAQSFLFSQALGLLLSPMTCVSWIATYNMLA